MTGSVRFGVLLAVLVTTLQAVVPDSAAQRTLLPVPVPVSIRSAPTAPGAPAQAGRYEAPVVPLRVVRGFSPPRSVYGSGHLGVDLAAALGAPVRAAADGIVTFSGPVAGRGVVVILHPDGLRTEYEPLRPVVGRGAQVRDGQVIGRVLGSHRGCAGSCLHWGARRDGSYVDPLLLLHALGVVRLLPWNG